MKKLTSHQIGQLHSLLIRNGSNDVLIDELIDHLACEVETYMWRGYNFELALEKVSQQANQKAIQYLYQTYKHDCAMTAEQLESASLDDIVFEFRNKEYGAYDLRQAYPNTLRRAFFMGIGIFLMLIGLTYGLSTHDWSLGSTTIITWSAGVALVAYSTWIWFEESKFKRNWAA
jgi:hypothetical protein